MPAHACGMLSTAASAQSCSMLHVGAAVMKAVQCADTAAVALLHGTSKHYILPTSRV
jgi:hypothetical protein